MAAYAEGIARLHAHGIAVQAGIVFGFDDDDGCFARTLREATQLGLDGATVSSLALCLLNWGYARALDNPVPGWPIPGGKRDVALHWPATRR